MPAGCRPRRQSSFSACHTAPSALRVFQITHDFDDFRAKKHVLFAHICEGCSSTLYLDERHIEWMSDVVLQHVLADLRPLVIPKLHAEKDVHFGPGASPSTKRGTVEVHRGETYQFAYFFRKTEPHTVLFKSRHFVTAPPRPEVAPKAVSRPTDQKKRSRTQASVQQGKRKRARTKGKGSFSQSRLGEDEWTAEASEEDVDSTSPLLRESRPLRKQRHSTAGGYREDDYDDSEDAFQDAVMMSPPPETGGGSSGVPDIPAGDDGGDAAWDTSGEPSPSPDTELLVEEEEKKPKPLLQLRYQSFSISGHCLCVVVEPWPPQRQEARLRPAGLGTSLRGGSLGPPFHPSNEFTVAGQRARTPLFFPENDRAASEAPFEREKTLPSVPLFHEGTEDHDYNDDLINFSQTLNAAGHMHTIAADDDDDMDGTALFGDADEVRELL